MAGHPVFPQILGVDPNTILAALLAAQAQAQAGAAPPPAAQPKPIPQQMPKAAVPVPGLAGGPEAPDDAGAHVTPDASWDEPMRQLYEMFRRHNIPPQVFDAFHQHGCTTPYEVMRSSANKEKAQNNMCLSLLLP